MAARSTQPIGDEALRFKNCHGYDPMVAIWMALLADWMREAGYAVAEHEGAIVAARPR